MLFSNPYSYRWNLAKRPTFCQRSYHKEVVTRDLKPDSPEFLLKEKAFAFPLSNGPSLGGGPALQPSRAHSDSSDFGKDLMLFFSRSYTHVKKASPLVHLSHYLLKFQISKPMKLCCQPQSSPARGWPRKRVPQASLEQRGHCSMWNSIDQE